MSERGRPRTPVAELKLKGTYRPDRHAGSDDFSPGGEPQKPDWLKGEASQLWDQTVKQLIDYGVATEIDAPKLSAMCDWWARYRKATRKLDELEYGDKGAHSVQILASQAWNNFASVAKSFGMTPADRTKLRLPTESKDRASLLNYFA